MIRAVRGYATLAKLMSFGDAARRGSAVSENVPLGGPKVTVPPFPAFRLPAARMLLGTVPGMEAAAARQLEPVPGAAVCAWRIRGRTARPGRCPWRGRCRR